MKKICFAWVCVCIVLSVSTFAWGQATTSLRGTIADQTGAVIPKAKVSLKSPSTGLGRAIISAADGTYEFLQILPGSYQLTVEKTGFQTYQQNDLELLVSTPATLNVTLTVGAATQTVAVTAEAPLINTTDATIGNTFTENQVKQLPIESRNVVDLLSLQPGVVFTSNRPDIDLNVDTRSGAVNGARSDQSNVTLDGVDVNDEVAGLAFTSVLRMTPDALEEFRVTTTNENSDVGRSSGAEVSLVTKSGTNDFHGALYEYNRNTLTSANDWFIKQAELSSDEPNQAPKLIRNIFGGAIGGPIKKDRAFFFANVDIRRDREAESTVRTVPSASLRQGVVKYLDVNGNVDALSPQQITAMDPLQMGPDAAVLNYFNSYPEPNDSSVGDGYNYSGFRFAAPVNNNFYTYIARLDYHLNSRGTQNLFWRGNLMNDLDVLTPALVPGLPPEVTQENFSKGFVLGLISNLGATKVNTLHWGLTRQSVNNLGDSTQPWILFRGLDQGITRSHGLTLPINDVGDDLSWSRGPHTLQFGAVTRFISNPRNSLQNSFSDGQTNASWLNPSGIANTGTSFDPAANGYPAVDSSFKNSYDFPMIALLGMVTEDDATYNYTKQGQVLAQGAPIPRHFDDHEYEFYGQDSYRFRPNLTVTYGLRWEIASPPWDVNGYQVHPNFSLGQWFNQRGVDGATSVPNNQLPTIAFGLGGPANNAPGLYHTDYHNLAPRLSFAFAPHPHSGFLQKLLGDGNKTSIRAGFGVAYDHFGMNILNTFDSNGSFGLSSTLTNPASIQTEDCAPRLTNLHVIPASGCAAAHTPGGNILIPAPVGQFPVSPPASLNNGGFAIAWGMDDTLKTPYTYMLNFSISRELSPSMTLEAAYVGHLAHRLLSQEDLAQPLNLVDKQSGVDYYTAAAQLARLGNAGVAVSAITPQVVGKTAAYWQDLFPALAGTSFNACGNTVATCDTLQAAYDIFQSNLHNETSALFYLDLPGQQCPNGCSIYGPFAYYDAQYSSLYAWRTISNSDYHALEVTLRRRFSRGLQFDFNYTLSKSIDLSSDAARISPWSGLGGQIINAWDYKQLRGVSDFDATHQVNANWIWEMPFGRGRAFGRGAHGLAEALIGGWQLSGLFRITSGFPVNISNGYEWPTNWQLGGQATLVGPAPKMRTTKNGDGTVNMFADGVNAISDFMADLPGSSGIRNPVRGDGTIGLDGGLAKRWKMPWSENHSLQFRWEVFNIPNWNRFDVQSNTPEIDISSTFGNYTNLLTNPRIMQFALRYEF
ncbi:MAG TPA: carboxypeptidase-like regulatory domain-containing protein [Terriglobia bacterium]|nr:carboxypeptidase-like regulatory domain-containing protein [Terriglobia bacterium]